MKILPADTDSKFARTNRYADYLDYSVLARFAVKKKGRNYFRIKNVSIRGSEPVTK